MMVRAYTPVEKEAVVGAEKWEHPEKERDARFRDEVTDALPFLRPALSPRAYQQSRIASIPALQCILIFSHPPHPSLVRGDGSDGIVAQPSRGGCLTTPLDSQKISRNR